MAYTAPDARTFAKKRKSLAEKITTELSLIDTELDTLVLGGLTLASGEIYVGDAGGTATAVTPSGDVTISNTGVTTIGAKKVTAAMTALADGKIMIGGATGVAAEKTLSGDITMTNEGVVSLAAGAIDPAVLTLAEGYIIVGDAGGGGDAVAMSGDVTIDKTGAVTIAAGAVEQSMIAANSLTGLVADSVSDANVIGGLPVIFRIAAPNDSTNTDVVSTHKIKVIDFWFNNTGVAAHATDDKIQLFNGSNAITDNIAKTATQYAQKRATTIDETRATISAGGTLRITTTKDTNCAADCYVLAMRVD